MVFKIFLKTKTKYSVVHNSYSYFHLFIYFSLSPLQKNIPFSEFFEVAPLHEYHRVLLMEEFLENIAPKCWPVGKRIGYCWLPPQSTVKCTLKVIYDKI